MAISIDHERFGMKQEFVDLAEAQQAIRNCGYQVTLEQYGDEIVC